MAGLRFRPAVGANETACSAFAATNHFSSVGARILAALSAPYGLTLYSALHQIASTNTGAADGIPVLRGYSSFQAQLSEGGWNAGAEATCILTTCI